MTLSRGTIAVGVTAAAGCALLAGVLLVPEWSVGSLARQTNALFQKHPRLYWCLAGSLLAALLAQVALPLALPGLANRAGFWTSRSMFVALSIATVLGMRLPGLAPLELNPDESATLAITLTLRDDPRYWLSTDGATQGPLNAYPLLLTRLCGMRLDYGAARLVGLGLLLGCVFFQFGTLRAFFSEAISRLAVTPLTICIAFLRFDDYIAYNAEHPTLFLLCGGGYGCARLAAGPAAGVARRALATGLTLGLVPFAKLQGAPAGLVLAAAALLCLVVRFRGERRRQVTAVLALVAGGIVPAAVVFLYLGSQGIFSHFWTSYIGGNVAYADASGKGLGDKLSYFRGWASAAPDELFFPFFLCVIGAGLLWLGLAHLAGRCWCLLLAGAAVLLACGYGVVMANHEFNHYLLFLLFPLAFLAAVVLATLHEAQPGRIVRPALAVVCLAAAVYLPAKQARDEDNCWLAVGPDQIDRHPDPVVELIRRYAAPGEKLVVWGWMDRYYVLSGMRQGTIRPNTYWEIHSREGMPYGDYFYRLFLRQFDRDRPPVFVDAVGVTAFNVTDRARYGHENYPELRGLIADHYELVGEVYETRVYVTKERLAERAVERPLIPEVPLPVLPSEVGLADWKNGTAECSGADSALVFSLRRPDLIRAIRLTFSYHGSEAPYQLRVCWRGGSRDDWDWDRGSTLALPGSRAIPSTLTIPVRDTVEQFLIAPDVKPCTFKLEQISLVVRAADQERMLKEYESWGSEQTARQFRQVVCAALPPEATVIVASDGNDELLKLEGRKAWPFPRTAPGTHSGQKPEGAAEAVGRLEALREKGGQYLLLPAEAFAWLDEHKEFERLLEDRYRRVLTEPYCIIYQLSEPNGGPGAVAEAAFEGSLDSASTDAILGWAWDSKKPNVPLTVDIFDGNKRLATRLAYQFRSDLLREQKGNGKHGFSFTPPASLRDGRPHTIRVVVSGTELDLSGSPRALGAP